MKLISTPALVLRRIKSGEADRIIILLTKELGKIKTVAKGIRKITSRRSPHLEIFSHVKVKIRITSKSAYIEEAQLIEPFTNIRKNLRQIIAVYHLCEVTDKILPEEEAGSQIYPLLLTALVNIENEVSGMNLRKTVREYTTDFLKYMGYLNNKSPLRYSHLLEKVQNIIERPLTTKNMLTLLAQEQYLQ